MEKATIRIGKAECLHPDALIVIIVLLLAIAASYALPAGSHAVVKTSDAKIEFTARVIATPYVGDARQKMNVTEFKVDMKDGLGDLTGRCAEAGADHGNGTGKLTKLSNSSEFAKVVWYCYYHKKWKKDANDIKFQRVLSKLNGGSGFPWNDYGDRKFHNGGKSVLNKVQEAADDYAESHPVPDGLEVFRADPYSSKYQEFIAWRMVPETSITVTKTSADRSTLKLPGYDLSGAELTLYKEDKATKVGAFTVKKTTGDSSTFKVPWGYYKNGKTAYHEYYVKETKRSRAGYTGDSAKDKWHKVTISKKTRKESVTIKNGITQAWVRVQKITDPAGAAKTGGYPLSGIQFDIYNSAGRKMPGSPLTTNTKGLTGKLRVVPGTYYAVERSVPAGSGIIRDESKTLSVSAANGKTVTLKKTNNIETGTVNICKKFDAGSDEDPDLAGFRFVLTDPMSGRKYTTAQTNSEGRLEAPLTGVWYGTYAVSEVIPEDKKKKYTDVTFSRTVTVGPGDNQNIEINWTNHYSDPGRLEFGKTVTMLDGSIGDADGFKFRLTDQEDLGKIYTAISKDGKVAFDGVDPGTYTLTEELTDEQSAYFKSGIPDGIRNINIFPGTRGTTYLKDAEGHTSLDEEHAAEIVNSEIPKSYSLIIKKITAGLMKETDEAFSFTVELSGMDKSDQSAAEEGMHPYYEICSEDVSGTRTVIDPGEIITGASFSRTFEISPGQILKFRNLPEGTSYKVTEEGDEEYIPSYRITEFDGTEPEALEASGPAGKDLSTGEGIFDRETTGARQTRIEFINYPVDDTCVNQVVVRKKVNDDTGASFPFRADFAGLTPNHYYCAVKHGTHSYYLTADRSGARVVDENDAPAAGVPIVLTRSDGKIRSFATDGEGLADFSGDRGWLTRKADKQISISWIGYDLDDQGNELRFDADSDDTISSVAEGIEITPFITDHEGKFTFGEDEFMLASGEEICFTGLDGSSKYRITELACSYSPDYSIFRVRSGGGVTETLDSSGEAGEDLSTDTRTFPAANAASDVVTFTNTPDTFRLKISKTSTLENDSTAFDFDVYLSGLGKNSYFIVRPGTAAARLDTLRSGDIQVNVSGSVYFTDVRNGDLSGIPVRIVRSDGTARTLYTDHEGRIGSSEYVSWLKAGQGEEFDYTIEFLDQTLEGKYRYETE